MTECTLYNVICLSYGISTNVVQLLSVPLCIIHVLYTGPYAIREIYGVKHWEKCMIAKSYPVVS